MIPQGIFAEAIFALGLALAGANVVALVRPWWLKRQGQKNVQEVGSKSRCYVNIAVGLAIMAVALEGMFR
jgi:hypothetical protein